MTEKRLKWPAENSSDTDFYETDEVLTSLQSGEAFVTVLSKKEHQHH